MVSFESLKSEYERNWANLQIRPARLGEANAAARRAINGKATYEQVERLTGVPWYFIALCHYRESNFDFDTYLGNGETLHRVTTLVPKGRGPFASFVDGAVDALRIENFVGTQDWCIARTLFRLECFNGLGYHAKGVNSPYLYGGSNLYGPPEAKCGKFVADHVFDPGHVDSQLGTAVILHAMMSQDSSITLDGSPLIASRSEPDDDMASSVLLMQQTLNKLGANPPLDEDGISGPKTKAAVSQFQQRNGLQDTGLLDGTTIAAITNPNAIAEVRSTAEGSMTLPAAKLPTIESSTRPIMSSRTEAPSTTCPSIVCSRLRSESTLVETPTEVAVSAVAQMNAATREIPIMSRTKNATTNGMVTPATATVVAVPATRERVRKSVPSPISKSSTSRPS